MIESITFMQNKPIGFPEGWSVYWKTLYFDVFQLRDMYCTAYNFWRLLPCVWCTYQNCVKQFACHLDTTTAGSPSTKKTQKTTAITFINKSCMLLYWCCMRVTKKGFKNAQGGCMYGDHFVKEYTYSLESCLLNVGTRCRLSKNVFTRLKL